MSWVMLNELSYLHSSHLYLQVVLTAKNFAFTIFASALNLTAIGRNVLFVRDWENF